MSDSVVPARFDDRLATVLLTQPQSAREKAAVWRQIVDMLAQSGPRLAQDDAARGLAALSVLRPHVPTATRLEAARSIATRCRFAPLAVLIGNDEPAIAVALFDGISLATEDWLAILPGLSPLARSRLRARTDMPLPVRRALESLGSVDFSLPGGEIVRNEDEDKPGAVEAGSNIAELVERIEAYRRRPASPANDQGASERSNDPVSLEDRHAILIDEHGWLRAVSGLPRAAFVGLQFAAPAMAGEAGVDAAVSRLFLKRGDIRGGRLQLHGNGPWSGCWLIDADAQFARDTGRFTGYEGSIAFATQGQPAPAAELVESEAISRPVADGIRQMAHELRSPLNAIVPRRDLHQLLQRLIALAASHAGSPGRMEASLCRGADGHAQIRLTCPDPEVQGNEFGIRLVQRMAEVHGGSLTFADGKAFLSLPCARDESGRSELIR